MTVDDRQWRVCPQCEERMLEKRCAKCNATTVLASVIQDPETNDPFIGRVLADQYELVGRLGKGGMGTVYRAIQLSVNRPVAVKLIAGEIASDLAVIKRFQREAQLTSRLTHPNSIRVFDFGVTDDGLLFLVMELLEGRDLAEHMAEAGAMPVERVVHIALQVLRSLREAHRAGIVHRDMKPSNVFLRHVEDEGDVVKVMDFGVAKVAMDEGTKVTKTGAVVGTPSYMSPEQAMGEEIDARTDLYALGVIMFEMVTGRPPFEGPTPVSVMLKHANDLPPALTAIRPDLAAPEALQKVLDKLLAKDPNDRPQDAQAAIDLLTPLVPGLANATPAVAVPIAGAGAVSPSMVTGVAEAAGATATTAPPPAKKRRAGAWLYVAVGAVIAVLVAAGLWFGTRSGGEGSAATAKAEPRALERPRPAAPSAPGAGTTTSTQTAEAPAEPAAPDITSADATVDVTTAAEVPAEAPDAAASAEVAATGADTAASAEVAAADAAESPEAAPEPALREVTIASEPSGATVEVGGVKVGKTPYVLPVAEPTKVSLSRWGYHSTELTVDPEGEAEQVVQLEAVKTARASAATPEPPPEESEPPKPPEPAPEEPEPPPSTAPSRTPLTARTSPASKPAPKTTSRPAPKTASKPRARNIAEAKAAFRAGKLTRQEFKAELKRLKLAYKAKIGGLKAQLRAGKITRARYDAQAKAAEAVYQGK